MNPEFYSFGEILWDCLPSGRHAGGAPFNVTAHLVQLGTTASLISAIGDDALGDEILAIARAKGVGTELIRRDTDLPTGTVRVTVDDHGDASYDIVRPVAWDRIEFPAGVSGRVAEAAGLIYGSLSCRSIDNVRTLRKLLAVPGPTRFFDVNLRPPFANPESVIQLAEHADLIKLNHEEVGQLAAWIRTGNLTCAPPEDPDSVARAATILAEATDTARICVTRAEKGALLWDRGEWVTASAPQTTVRDTVGAGDSFMAGLMVGLTRGIDLPQVLENACRIGAFVASRDGATPALPKAMTNAFTTTKEPKFDLA